LFDTGRAVCMRLAGAGVLPLMLDSVLLTHLHSDHICDLGDVITTQWVMSPDARPLRIFGPPRTQEVVNGVMASLAPDVGYRRGHHADLNWDPQLDVQEIGPGVVLDDGGVRIVAAATDHRPVEPTLAFRVEHDGDAVVIAGDTVPCPGLDDLCQGADIYVQTVPMQRFRDTIDYHSTVEQAARTAAKAGVGTLVLTHQIPTPAPGSVDEWVGIAAGHFDGRVLFGEDLLHVSTQPG
jgi:ribonuclease Z